MRNWLVYDTWNGGRGEGPARGSEVLAELDGEIHTARFNGRGFVQLDKGVDVRFFSEPPVRYWRIAEPTVVTIESVSRAVVQYGDRDLHEALKELVLVLTVDRGGTVERLTATPCSTNRWDFR